jgi:cytosine/adenosine deaminase-related metal-dependent hydrolase
MWSALRAGATTILDVGTMPGGPDAFTKLVGELGVRAYLGPGFRSAEYRFDGDRVYWEWNEANGTAGLARAIDYVKKYDGAHNGRIRAMIYPGQMDTCTLDLLRGARQAADELEVPLQLHAAMNQREFHKILEQYGKTPIALLHSIGFLKPKSGIGHCVFHNRHSWCHYPYGDDLKMLADCGTTVVHAPYKYAKMGIKFESFARYRAAGINIAIGTDTYPQDMIHEMRWAAMMSRIADERMRSAPVHATDGRFVAIHRTTTCVGSEHI